MVDEAGLSVDGIFNSEQNVKTVSYFSLLLAKKYENNLYFEFGGATAVARVSKYELCKVGDEVEFVFVPHRMHFFDSETEEAIVL